MAITRSALKAIAADGQAVDKKLTNDAVGEDWSWIREEDPVGREKMLKHKRSAKFIEGEKEEMAVMAAQKVWKLVPRVPGMNVLGSMWV